MSRIALEPFRGKAVCPKCGSKNTSTYYCERPLPPKPCWKFFDSRHELLEHLDKRCRSCQHVWFTELWDGIEYEEDGDGSSEEAYDD